MLESGAISAPSFAEQPIVLLIVDTYLVLLIVRTTQAPV